MSSHTDDHYGGLHEAQQRELAKLKGARTIESFSDDKPKAIITKPAPPQKVAEPEGFATAATLPKMSLSTRLKRISKNLPESIQIKKAFELIEQARRHKEIKTLDEGYVIFKDASPSIYDHLCSTPLCHGKPDIMVTGKRLCSECWNKKCDVEAKV